MGTTRKTYQDTPVLHNANPEGIRMGMVLTAFEGFTATSDYQALSTICKLQIHMWRRSLGAKTWRTYNLNI